VSADSTGLPDPVDRVGATPSSGSRQLSIEERRRRVAESLRIGNPGNHARDLPADADPRHECQIELRVTDIHPYEHNPRRAANAKFAEIKESIRAAGIRNPLTVTRRPGESHFIVESGGNTRLLAVQQLWTETADPRFEKLSVLFRPWRSESHVLMAHMVENEQRGDMTFWDRATGIIAIKERLEADKGQPLSLRQLEAELIAMGLATNPTSLSHYVFVTEKLRVLGESVPDLSAQDIKTIQPRLNALKRYALARGDVSEAVLHASIVEPVLRQAAERYRQGEGFAATQLCLACEAALARHVDEPLAQLRRDVAALSRPDPDLPRRISNDSSALTAPGPDTAHAPRTDTNSARRPPHAVNAVDSESERAGPTTAPAEVQVRDASGSSCEARSALAELGQRLAEQAGIGAYLRLDPLAPMSLRMFVETHAGLELEPSALRVWWLLDRLFRSQPAGQGAQITDGARVPFTASCDSAPGDAVRISEAAGDLLDWLLNPNDALAGATLEFLGRLRAWRASETVTQRLEERRSVPREDA